MMVEFCLSDMCVELVVAVKMEVWSFVHGGLPHTSVVRPHASCKEISFGEVTTEYFPWIYDMLLHFSYHIPC